MPWIPGWLRKRPAPDAGRWVVVDVESSGLDTRRDRILAIGALAVHRVAGARPRLQPGDSFEVVVQQAQAAAAPDKSNILLHGIGVGAQRAGVPPAEALQAFSAWVGASPLVAYHAGFDRAMLVRACREARVAPLPDAWLDLAPLAALLHPQVRARSLDEWLAHFAIPCAVRHQAASDTLAEADLLLRLWPAVEREKPGADFRALQRLAAAHRWLEGPV